jgi:hypothetical protein
MPAQESTSDPATVEARRHAELVEYLRSISAGIEASYQIHDRQLRALVALEARAEAMLRYLVQVLHVVLPGQHRVPRKPRGGRS